MKVFWLSAKEPANWLSPKLAVDRLSNAFDHVTTDWEAGRQFGAEIISTYQRILEAGLEGQTSTPLEVVEREWRDAVVLRGWDDSDATAPFEVVLNTEGQLKLKFAPKTPFQKKRRTAEKVAAALGYQIEHFDPDD